jgi:hypothetical protein
MNSTIFIKLQTDINYISTSYFSSNTNITSQELTLFPPRELNLTHNSAQGFVTNTANRCAYLPMQHYIAILSFYFEFSIT